MGVVSGGIDVVGDGGYVYTRGKLCVVLRRGFESGRLGIGGIEKSLERWRCEGEGGGDVVVG